MDDLAAVMLRKQILRKLGKLEERAKSEGKRLTQKASKNGISVLDAFDVPLEKSVAELLAKDISFLASFKEKTPTTVLELIRYSGGLSVCIEKLMDYRTYDPKDSERARLQDQDPGIIDYVDVIEQMLVKAKGKTPQKQSSDKISKDYTTLALPFCALCFRRVNQSAYYCKEHHSSRNANAYKQATRRLISAVYRHATDEYELMKLEQYKSGDQKLDAKILYRWLGLFSVPPTLAIKDLNKLNQHKDYWRNFSHCIFDFTSEHYPHAFKQIPKIVDQESFDDWIIDVVESLGGQVESNMWQYRKVDVWIDNSTLMEKSLTLLVCLSRYESMCTVANFEVKSGSRSGSQIDKSKHRIAHRLLEERKIDDSITVTYISKESGLSRSAIYKIINKSR